MMSIVEAFDSPRALSRTELRSAPGVTDGILFSRALGFVVKAGLIFKSQGRFTPDPSAMPI